MTRCQNPVSRRLARLVLAVLVPALLLASSACARGPGTTDGSDAGLQRLLNRWRQRADLPAVVLAVQDSQKRRWVGTSGTPLRGSGPPVSPHAPFRIASITKTFVATVVLQLAQEGRLDLDDRVARYVPDFPHADGLTIRQLLQHTSGLPDFGRAKDLNRQLVRDRDRRWSAAEVLSLAAAKEPDFAPGTDFSYSNTNYVLLGEVIGSVTGSTWAEQVRARILDPLRMADTYVAGAEPLPVGVIPAYFDLDEDGDQENVENGRPWTSLETSEGAAGAIVSTASDLITFGDALFHGRLLRPDMMRAMVAEGDHHPRNRGYGLGLEIERPDYRTTIWGHGGHLPGFRSTLWYVPSNDLLITVLANDSRTDPRDLAELTMRAVTGPGTA